MRCFLVRSDFGVDTDWAERDRTKNPRRRAQQVQLDAARSTDGAWTVAERGRTVVAVPGVLVAWTRVTPIEDVERRTPGWAIVLGVLGLLVFLIGIVFFFVKQDVRTKSALIEIVDNSGRMLVLRAPGLDAVVFRAAIGAM